MVGVGSEILHLVGAYVVAPGEEITDGVIVHDGFEHPGPPCGVGNVLVPAFGHGHHLVVFLGEVGEEGEVGVECLDKILLRAPLVGIFADELHTVVARIARLEALLVPSTIEVGRIAPQEVVEPLSFEEILEGVPQSVVLLVGTQFLSPPEPGAVVLMPRSEDDRNGFSLVGLEGLEEVGHPCHPCVELLLDGVVLEDLSYDGGVFHIPGVSSRDRVPRMPADGDDTPTGILLDNLVVYACESHTVEVFLVAHLNASEVEAHDCGIVAHGGKDVTLFHTRHGVAIPSESIEGVVFMTIHIAFLLQGLQPVEELVGTGFWSFLLCCACEHHGEGRRKQDCFFHIVAISE